jgi:nicotinamidase-related amidase
MKAAVLVIDLQRWFLEVGPPEKLERVRTLVAKTNELLDAFHQRQLPVIVVQTIHQADGSTWNQWMKEHNTGRLIEGSREAEAHPALRTFEADVMVRKTRHSAFIRTDLERILRQLGVDCVVLAGFSTNLCVGLTAIEAWERDFRVLLAGEAILGTTPEEGDRMLDYLRSRFEMVAVPNAYICEALGDP